MPFKAIIGNQKADYSYRQGSGGETAIARDITVLSDRIIISETPSEKFPIKFKLFPKCEILYSEINSITVNGMIKIYFNNCNVDKKWHNGVIALITSELDDIAKALRQKGMKVDVINDPLNSLFRKVPWQNFYPNYIVLFMIIGFTLGLVVYFLLN
ncbi:hypothetical protein KC946_01515 [Candidatus Saccharibacteria bacterium]|nr:hypothetical protein [Candidatus Saccharibacteria bacterium]